MPIFCRIFSFDYFLICFFSSSLYLLLFLLLFLPIFSVPSFRNSPTAVSLILASVIMKFEEFEYSTPELFRITFFVSLLILFIYLFIYLFFDVFLIIFSLFDKTSMNLCNFSAYFLVVVILFSFLYLFFTFFFITLSFYLSQPIFCFFLMFILYWY